MTRLQHMDSVKAGRGTETLRRPGPPIFPVKADNETLAVLVVPIDSDELGLPPDQQQAVEAFANLAGVAIVRVRLAEEAEQSRWLAESEKVHRALLLSVSHDLRTPLASITGGVTGLLSKEDVYDREATRGLISGSEAGTGLGLSICRAIMEAHGGMIWIDSPFGQGNIFTFALPFQEGPSEWEAEEGENHAA